MHYGFLIPDGDIHTIGAMAREAEAAGWDAVFYWDGICIEGKARMYDPWVVLAAIALCTTRVRLGAMLTPLSRRRPWKLARETASVDHLSGGRLVVPVGLGALDDGGFARVGEVTARRERAELLDEGLEILVGLWSGEPFSYQGRHYHLESMTFTPAPLQKPRIPLWVVGAWPREKSMQRVLRYDGLLPNKLSPDGTQMDVTPDDIRAMKAYIDQHRTLRTPFDIISEGETPGDNPARAAAIVRPYAEAGSTWWLEARWQATTIEEIRTRIRQGPPSLQ
jgi:alkanesulfonate monooxygenase SsuD/methylene tetrahydromethanopterin reductase-like flavin-dependent oxidoreductase (luciferase family)